jgi:hypothetical protein
MLVSKVMLNCVCFVCAYFDGELKPVGSAFFLGVAAPHTN